MFHHRITFATVALVAAVGCSDDTNPPNPNPGVYPERVASYIQGSPYTRLSLEVDSVAGLEPNQLVTDGVITRLSPLLDKDTVEVVFDQTVESNPNKEWTFADLKALASQHYDGPNASDQTVIHVLVLDGHYSETEGSERTLGLAWDNRHIVLFAETLKDTCSPDANDELKRRGLVERACNATLTGTWLHEIGHVIGLVNNGLEMVEVHNDPDHPHHDADPNSLMYWMFDVVGIFDEVKGKVLDDVDPIPSFGDACLADIDALKNAPTL
jgi:hypothetical protein